MRRRDAAATRRSRLKVSGTRGEQRLLTRPQLFGFGALVDAMERDMGTTIATKSDLQLIRREMATKADLADLRQEAALLRKDLEMLPTVMTVRLGSRLVVGLGVQFAALKLM
jgi:hypothetical protein